MVVKENLSVPIRLLIPPARIGPELSAEGHDKVVEEEGFDTVDIISMKKWNISVEPGRALLRAHGKPKLL